MRAVPTKRARESIEEPSPSFQDTPEAFVQDLLALLTPPSPKDVRVATKEALAAHRHLKRRKTPGKEAVIESLYRCRMTDWLQKKYGIEPLQLPQYLNSSHLVPRRVCIDRTRHSHVEIPDATWKISWPKFRRRYSEWVDTALPGTKHPGKADLFFAVSGEIVSIEFKYGLGAVPECSEQVRRYLTHAATILAVYGVAPVSGKFEDTLHMMRHRIASRRAHVVGIVGPPIPWPSTSGEKVV